MFEASQSERERGIRLFSRAGIVVILVGVGIAAYFSGAAAWLWHLLYRSGAELSDSNPRPAQR